MSLALAAPASPPAATAPATAGYWTGVGRRFRRDKVAMAAALLLALVVLVALLAPYITPADPFRASMLRRLRPIGTPGFPLGSDELGRDMLSRLMLGARLSLFIGVTPVVIAFVVGSSIGVFAGFVGGWAGTLVMRAIDVFYAFPSVLLAVALSGALGAGFGNALLSLTVVFIPPIARVAESVTAGMRGSDFVMAARASGASAFTIVRVHVLGNVLGPVFVYATSLISVSMILASGLSFLGLGAQPPSPDWGALLADGQSYFLTAWWIATFPGLAIFLVVLGFNLLGDALRDHFDPRRRS